MNLQEFVSWLGQSPDFLILYFVGIPLLALLCGVLGRNEGHLSPWREVYAVLVYLVCVPGIFAVTLNIYLFLFERRSIFQTDLYTQIIPILVMILTLWLIRRNVSLQFIPGFKSLSGLMLMIFGTISLMWFLDRTRIVVFSYLPFQYLLGIFAVLFVAIYLGWKRFFG